MKSLPSIDVLKLTAVIGVVVIHLLSFLPKTETNPSLSNLFISLDQFFRFCVPLFVAISGFTLMKRYGDGVVDWKDFYLKRIKKTIPLYLLWSGILVYLSTFDQSWSQFLNGATLPQILLFGRADYHLYFVPMIFSFYLLFPLIKITVIRVRWLVLLVSLAFEIWFFSLIGKQVVLGLTPRMFGSDQQQYIFFGSWIFYFVLGAVMARLDFETKRKIWWAAVVIFVGVILIGFQLSLADVRKLWANGVDLLMATRFTRIPILIYSTGVIGLTLFTACKLKNVRGFFLKGLSFLGRQSYIIYLSHTIWLRIIFGFINQEISPDILIFSTLVTVGGTWLSWWIDGTL